MREVASPSSAPASSALYWTPAAALPLALIATLTAGAIALEGYRESSVAKPLAFTGAYTGESAQRSVV